jgi:hypothetical protein
MSVPVRVVGIVQGREIDAAATTSVDNDALVLHWERATPWRLAFDGIEGVHAGTTSLTVYLHDHDVLELTGDEQLRPLALQLLDRACCMPELTRGLRAFGATRDSSGARADHRSTLHGAHDRWFAPLLAARRAVHGVSDPLRQVTLLDGAALSAEMLRAIEEIAATRAPGDPAEQRAVEAALEDEAAPLFSALERLAIAGEAVRGGATDTRFSDWRRWRDAARLAYAAADEVWDAFSEVLG